jgi:hypothetical protein
MKSKQLHPWRKAKWVVLIALTTTVIFSGCKKDVQHERIAESQQQKFEKPVARTNPFSYSNIQKAKATIDAKGLYKTGSAQSRFSDDRLYTYMKFDPNELPEEVMRMIEADSTIHIMDFPFANGELYNDEFALDESKAEQMRDGMLYAVVPKSSITKTTLTSVAELRTVQIDELYLPDEEDTTLQFQALREAGYTEEMLARIRICLFKRPAGFVRYEDDRLGRMEPVRGMQVWGLVFGIPLHTYTDANGYYRFPWRFSAGTIMGTHAKNPRVNIKPLNTNGTLIQVIPQLIINFIFGSIHIRGWVSSCQMRDDVNFDFGGHTQVRYWSQLLNAYFFHDQYTRDDNVDNAPYAMTVYAQWANNGRLDESGVPDFGNASTPMLNKNWSASLIISVIANLLNFLPPVQFLRLVNAVPPDMTFRVPANTQPQFYCERLAQTAFHELGHAMHYSRAGNGYWYDYIAATLRADPIPGNPYGNGLGVDDGNVAVGESWAEFIGTNHVIRRYGTDALKTATFLRADIFGNPLPEYQANPFLQENEFYFFGGQWIPYGFYHDLIDDSQIPITNPERFWDRVNGITIRQLYMALGSDEDLMCDYLWTFLQQNPGVNMNDVIEIAMRHNFNCF